MSNLAFLNSESTLETPWKFFFFFQTMKFKLCACLSHSYWTDLVGSQSSISFFFSSKDPLVTLLYTRFENCWYKCLNNLKQIEPKEWQTQWTVSRSEELSFWWKLEWTWNSKAIHGKPFLTLDVSGWLEFTSQINNNTLQVYNIPFACHVIFLESILAMIDECECILI